MPKRILLADDSVTIQKVVELTFMDQDYEVVSVSNGDEAMARLDSGAPFDLVIADVHMPGANGYDVCRHAKTMAPDLPVLLLVGTFEPFDEADAAASGSDGFLKKPFDSQQLLGLAESLLAAAGAEKEASDAQPSDDEEWAVDELDAEELPELEAVEGDSWAAGASGLFEAVPAEEPASESTEHEARSEEDAGLPVPPVVGGVDPGATMAIPVASPMVLDETVPTAAADEVAEAAASETAEPAEAEGVVEAVVAAPAAVPPTLSDEEVDRIARRVVELISEKVVREVAWDVLPDLAEVAVNERIRELESQLE